MTTYDVLVEVRLRPGIADPAGATVERALPALGFREVNAVRMGKAIRFRIEADDADTARRRADELSRCFLTNPVIEDFAVTISDVRAAL